MMIILACFKRKKIRIFWGLRTLPLQHPQTLAGILHGLDTPA